MANKRLQIQAIEIEEFIMKFCDLNCEYGAWPEDNSLDGSRSCRTFQAIYCKKKGRHVHKNMPCPEKIIRGKGHSAQLSEVTPP
jgi:hypothetical protein